MPSPISGPPSAAPTSSYPQLDEATLSAINQKLLDVVSLLHAEGLSAGQLREISANIAIQTANTEKLHSFVLSNADEPAFFLQLYSGVSDD
jgi:hypothetical protein